MRNIHYCTTFAQWRGANSKSSPFICTQSSGSAQPRSQDHTSGPRTTTTANDGMQWDDFNDTDDEIGEVASNNDSTSSISSMPSMRQVYEKSQEFLLGEDVRKLNSANKDGTSEDVLRTRIASLLNDCPDSYQNFEV
jgi:hypothetical protein